MCELVPDPLAFLFVCSLPVAALLVKLQIALSSSPHVAVLLHTLGAGSFPVAAVDLGLVMAIARLVYELGARYPGVVLNQSVASSVAFMESAAKEGITEGNSSDLILTHGSA